MQTLQAIIVGAIQGLSEFLPISSSAHIVFSHELYNLIVNTPNIEGVNQEEIFFDIIVHLATLFAILIYFFKDLKNIFSDFIKKITTKDFQNENFKLICFIILSTIITSIIGLSIVDIVAKLTTCPKIICILLAITGILLLFSEKLYKGNKKISFKSTVFISLAQGLAIFPGFSRSGFTIATGLLCGMDRVSAARFSFLISIPIIILASLVYPIMKLDFSKIMTFNFEAIILGAITSFIVGYLCISKFMKLLGKLSLKSFGYYCILIAVVMFLLFEFCYHQ